MAEIDILTKQVQRGYGHQIPKCQNLDRLEIVQREQSKMEESKRLNAAPRQAILRPQQQTVGRVSCLRKEVERIFHRH
jgi:hypothetical protein